MIEKEDFSPCIDTDGANTKYVTEHRDKRLVHNARTRPTGTGHSCVDLPMAGEGLARRIPDGWPAQNTEVGVAAVSRTRQEEISKAMPSVSFCGLPTDGKEVRVWITNIFIVA